MQLYCYCSPFQKEILYFFHLSFHRTSLCSSNDTSYRCEWLRNWSRNLFSKLPTICWLAYWPYWPYTAPTVLCVLHFAKALHSFLRTCTTTAQNICRTRETAIMHIMQTCRKSKYISALRLNQNHKFKSHKTKTIKWKMEKEKLTSRVMILGWFVTKRPFA